MRYVAAPKLLTQVAAVHFVSHVHIMLIPALLPVLPSLLGVGFVELGVALAVFNIVSALVQAPLGHAVDHFGARKVLKAGLLLGSLSFLLLAASPGHAVLLVSMALAGLANGVYHPADYALLAKGIEPDRLGRSFSIHTFAGFLGSAVTPAIFLGIAAVLGTRAALATGAVFGAAALLLISLPGSGVYRVTEMATRAMPARAGKRPSALVHPHDRRADSAVHIAQPEHQCHREILRCRTGARPRPDLGLGQYRAYRLLAL